ncbi:MAG TPA: outer membrane beta-barrel protein [Candidatus Limnocylindria bacterium]|nr:outer membrane beta-barrel protein [Candidatus Limnocylindria bacterium]
MSRSILAGFLFLLLATTAHAQLPTRGDAYIGYSYFRAGSSANNSVSSANLNGWNASVEFKLLPWIGGVADFGGNYGTERVPLICPTFPSCPVISLSASDHTFLFGPRVSVSIGKFKPFVHGLFGGARTKGNGSGFSISDTAFATALGGGVDYRLVRGIAWRAQADDVRTSFFSGTQHNFRFSTGLVLHF